MAPTKMAFINKIFLVVTAFSFLTVIPSNSAVAIPIDIKPSFNDLEYTGTYRVNGGATVTGPTTVELPPGQHRIDLAPGVAFSFTVAADGVVTSLSKAAKGGDKTLTFNTIEVKVYPGDYTGTYSMRGVDDEKKPGERTFVLMPEAGAYILDIASSVGFRFRVAADGDVSDQVPAKGGPNTLTFNTTTVEVVPGAYTGTYSMRGVDDEKKPGERTFVLMPGVGGYPIDIKPALAYRFNVDDKGVPDPTNLLVEIDNVEYTFVLTKKDVILTVGIDIKPGEFPNPINPNARGKIPVAILSTATFDATTVDRASVRFGKTGTEASEVKSEAEPDDVDQDGDGDVDLLLHFQTQETGILCGNTAAMIKGRTSGAEGIEIEGSDSIKTVGC